MIFGSDIKLSDEGLLVFAKGIEHPDKPHICYSGQLTPVLYSQNGITDSPLYYIYEDVYYKKDKEIFKNHSLQYNITVLRPGLIGNEFIKTAGHFHPLKNTGKETYSEYHEVLSGEAIFLLQSNDRNDDVEDAIAIEAKTGDKVYIPSNYGHVLINAGENFLVVAHIFEVSLPSTNESFAEKCGAAYFYVQNKDGKADWIKNPNYKNSVGLKIKAAPKLTQEISEVNDNNLYSAFIKNPSAFNILTN